MHVHSDHHMSTSVMENMSFDTFEQFTEWKSELEKTTSSKFVQHYAPKARLSKKHIYYYCHRTGQQSKLRDIGVHRNRTLKKQGSCKVRRTCTAHISCAVDMTTNRVKVSYCSLHVGHDMELQHLRLSSEVRLQVADLLHQGVPISTVIDTMRDQLGPALERDKLLSRRDVHNIRAAFNIGSAMKAADDDHTYFTIWAEQLNDVADDSAALVYQPQGAQLTEETMDLDEVPSTLAADQDVIECETVRKQLMSEIQQLMALASTCNDTAALQSMLTHFRAALAIAQASTRYQPKSRTRPVLKKLAAKRKLNR